MTSRTKLTRKQGDDVLGGDETWKHADSTAGMLPTLDSCIPALTYRRGPEATCPKCDNDRAYFYQLQIRSADEPMTTCKPFINSFFVQLTLPGLFLPLAVYR